MPPLRDSMNGSVVTAASRALDANGLGPGLVTGAVERAIESGSAHELTAALVNTVADEVKHRLSQVLALQRYADGRESVPSEYVEAMLGLQAWATRVYEVTKDGAHAGTRGEHRS